MASWFGRIFEFEEDCAAAVAQRGHNKFDRVHAHLKAETASDGSHVLTVVNGGKRFWVGR
jgi:hypothetical protein